MPAFSPWPLKKNSVIEKHLIPGQEDSIKADYKIPYIFLFWGLAVISVW